MLYLIARFVLRPMFWVPPADHHRPAERAGYRPVHHREQPPVLHRQHGHPAGRPAPGRLPGQGRVLHGPRHRRVADSGAVHRPGRAAGGARTHRAAQEALDTASACCSAAAAFGIYPEGTRSRDGRLARGKTGVAWLALTADCPVVPVAVAGTDRIQPIGASWPRPHRFSVTFGKPLTFPEYRGKAGNGKARREVTDTIMEAIAELSGQEKAGVQEPTWESKTVPELKALEGLRREGILQVGKRCGLIAAILEKKDKVRTSSKVSHSLSANRLQIPPPNSFSI